MVEGVMNFTKKDFANANFMPRGAPLRGTWVSAV
jgi:hypothetical protein